MLAALAVAALAYTPPDQLVETDWVAAHAADANVRVADMRQAGYAGGISAARLWWILNCYGAWEGWGNRDGLPLAMDEPRQDDITLVLKAGRAVDRDHLPRAHVLSPF